MRRTALALLVAATMTGAGVARGDGATFAVLAGSAALPSPLEPNAALVVDPAWTTPPAQPVQLSPEQLLRLWQAAGQAYGVPWTVLAAINKVESNFGRSMGPSSAGAIGWMQFLPSTWLRWGMDANGDGLADPWNPVDAIYSAARYLAASGAATDLRQAVFAYNHADWYVNEVLQLAQLYAGSDGVPADQWQAQTVFALDRLQAQIAAAAAAVGRANDAYLAAAARAQGLADHARELSARAAQLPLLSDQLAAEKVAAQAGTEASAAQAQADQLKQALAAAQARLAQLQAQANGAAFDQPAGALLGAAPAEPVDGYVFPVGGGPAVVSVSHLHHDYPAADIAAPEGAPVYALSDGVVLDAWSSDPSCGTGFTIRTTDGQTWTYCHLSVLDPSVTPGAELSAGAAVGLVGASGDATGPHLHLQLQPASSYPQAQPWFQAFAGTAFRWQDDATAADGGRAVAARPLVFHVVGT